MKVKKIIFKNLVLLFSFALVVQVSFAQQATNPSNALEHYLHNGDTSYHWIIKDSFELGSVKGYDLLLTSQHWHQYIWEHQLTILAPKEDNYDGALLFITGGHNNKETEIPNWTKPNNGLTKAMIRLAEKNNAIVAIIHQVPNEPLYDSLVEDQIISYTLHRYQEDTANYTWPLLFPMVKSAVRAMDAVQYFSQHHLDHTINRFIISGASKRGWTTWLTGASDPRVVAIGPMVIDILNMPVNLEHQMKAYGGYSVEIEDYVKLGIVKGLTSSSGKALIDMIDPYSYRKKLTMPKMLFMGTNDPYWVIDNVKNYLPEIPGINLINYTPNAGHGLNDGVTAFPALSAFVGITLDHGKYPQCTWKIKENHQKAKIMVNTSKDILLGAKVWYANSKDMDFRNDTFYSRDLNLSHVSKMIVNESFPKTGYHAFYVALTYQDPKGGEYQVCTRVFMTDTSHVFK